MRNRDLAGCAPPRRSPRASCSNRGDTNRYTIPRYYQPCHKGHNHSQETILPAQCLRNRLLPHLSLEIFPATCWPSISRQAEIHHPTHKLFRTTHHAPQIQTPLQSADVYPPIWRKLLRQEKQSATQDNFLSL